MTGNNRNNIEMEFMDIDSKGAWPVLYQHIRSECSHYDFTALEAKKIQNKNLNRYRDVSPYDHSRIVLLKGSCDYINASLVTISKADRRYILTQGPLSHTTGHFWLMVWEQNCKAVLMLNKVIEKKQEKCHQYWPLGEDDEMVLNDVGLKVRLISQKCASYFIIRTLRLTEIESESSHDILHFHYTTWPDFGVPDSPTAFLDFLVVVRQSGVLSPNVGPPVVHCSAGIGRSGTFCLVDSCLVLIEESGIESVNVRDILLEMRKFRMGLIQTPDQLRFSYLAIIEGAKRYANKDNIEYILSSIQYTENTVNNSKIELFPNDHRTDMDNNEESPPPPPPPRGESLKKCISSVDNDYFRDNVTENDIGLPPDKPLPVEPPNDLPNSISTNDESPSPCSENDFEYEQNSMEQSVQSILENTKENDSSILRQRKQEERKEKRERLASQVREMKRRQEETENWQDWKRSLLSPLNIGVGVGILLIGGGVFAYVCYSNRI